MGSFPPGTIPILIAGNRASLGLGSAIGNAISQITNTIGSTSLTASRCYYFPFEVYERTIAKKLAYVNGNTPDTAQHVDMGIFDDAGNKIVSTGSVAQAAGAGNDHIDDITDTELPIGSYYYGFVSDSSSVSSFNVLSLTSTSSPKLLAAGMKIQASTFPLPSTATFTDYTSGNVPNCFIIV